MNHIPLFIGFRDRVTSEYSIYLFNGKDRFENIENPNGIFDLETFQKYPAAFIQAETLKEIEEGILLEKHKSKWGNGKGTDVICPTCGFGYNMIPYSEFDNGLNEFFAEIIPCICGTKLKATIQVEISYDVDIIKT